MREMLRNEHYQRDIKYFTLFTRNILLALGIWPNSGRKRSISDKVQKYLSIIIAYIIIYCTLVPGVFYWVIEKRARVRLRMATIILYALMTIVKYGNLIIREGQIRRCLKHIEEDWKNVDAADSRNTMLESAKTGRRLALISAAFLYSSGMSLRILVPLSKGKMVTEQNITIRPLPYPIYLFSIDIQKTPVYEITYTMECLSGLVSLSIASGVCGLIIIFVMHACGQLKILMGLIKCLGDEKWQERLEANKKLAGIVEHQIRIRGFLQLVEHTLDQICFTEIIGATVIICALGYCLIMEWENSNALAICSYLISLSTAIVEMFMFCYTGEKLIAQAEKVAAACCQMEWYHLPEKKAREIVLVMIISNMPTKITAGKLIDLSFKSFGNILKTAAAYLNVLRNVTD